MPNSPPLTQLAHLPALSEALRALAHRGEVRRYRKNTLLIEEGDHGDTLYLILAGRLRSYAIGDKGREITYGVYGPGEYLGEMSLDGGPRSANVITLEASSCVVITRTTLERHIAEYPQFAFELIAKVIRRARAATLSAKQLALNDVYGRLVLLLNSLAVARPDGTRRIEERLTHQELANRLGCSREMVSRLMKDLEHGGYLQPQPGQWQLLRPLPARW
jgi:CRP/FNR family cyclic AMP-dependent transcriptional regulator